MASKPCTTSLLFSFKVVTDWQLDVDAGVTNAEKAWAGIDGADRNDGVAFTF